MPEGVPHGSLQANLRAPFRQGWDIDFIRAKFNLSSRDVEKAIQHAGDSREKIIEYLRKLFSRK